MAHSTLERLKPAAGARTHTLLAAGLWALVGAALAGAGAVWCLASRWPWSLLLLAASAVLGAAKARWILAPVARANADRIAERGNGRCLGGFVSWRTWLLISGMMVAGLVLRNSPVPLPILGVVYAAVGVALLLGSRPLWMAWSALGGA